MIEDKQPPGYKYNVSPACATCDDSRGTKRSFGMTCEGCEHRWYMLAKKTKKAKSKQLKF